MELAGSKEVGKMRGQRAKRQGQRVKAKIEA